MTSISLITVHLDINLLPCNNVTYCWYEQYGEVGLCWVRPIQLDGCYLVIRYHYVNGNEMMLSHSTAWKLMDTHFWNIRWTFACMFSRQFLYLTHPLRQAFQMSNLFHIIVLCSKVDTNMGLKGCQCVCLFLSIFGLCCHTFRLSIKKPSFRLHRGACYVQINLVVLPFHFSWRITASGRGWN